jgi:hypothetical protein
MAQLVHTWINASRDSRAAERIVLGSAKLNKPSPRTPGSTLGVTFRPSLTRSGITVKVIENLVDGRVGGSFAPYSVGRIGQGYASCDHPRLHTIFMSCCDGEVCASCFVRMVTEKKCWCGSSTRDGDCPMAQTRGVTIATEKVVAALVDRSSGTLGGVFRTAQVGSVFVDDNMARTLRRVSLVLTTDEWDVLERCQVFIQDVEEAGVGAELLRPSTHYAYTRGDHARRAAARNRLFDPEANSDFQNRGFDPSLFVTQWPRDQPPAVAPQADPQDDQVLRIVNGLFVLPCPRMYEFEEEEEEPVRPFDDWDLKNAFGATPAESTRDAVYERARARPDYYTAKRRRLELFELKDVQEQTHDAGAPRARREEAAAAEETAHARHLATQPARWLYPGGQVTSTPPPPETNHVNPQTVHPEGGCSLCGDEEAKETGVMECCRATLCVSCYVGGTARRESRFACLFCKKVDRHLAPPLRLENAPPVQPPPAPLVVEVQVPAALPVLGKSEVKHVAILPDHDYAFALALTLTS